jgi:tripeptide aminopeptidase
LVCFAVWIAILTLEECLFVSKGVTAVKLEEQRIVNRFLELVKINTPSHKEKPMADYLKKVLAEYGCEVEEDGAADEILRTFEREVRERLIEQTPRTGNLIATLKGNVEGAPTILFSAHMDTVVSTEGIRPDLENGVVRTDGKTILGADDRAGICAILEAIRYLQENDVKHGDLQFVFTVAEETGLYGSRFLDMSRIKAEYAFVMDSGGAPDTIITAAPAEVDFTVLVYGKAAHSGVNPEDGINAIKVAAEAIAHLQLGRIDEETTMNVGIIKGGEKTNIVADRCEILGEVRSRNNQKVSEQMAKVHAAFTLAAEKYGARVDIDEFMMYGSFNLSEEDEVVRLAMAGLRKAGLEPKLAARGGGSDTNNLNNNGIPAVNLGVGATNDHTVHEEVKVVDLLAATRIVIGIVQSAAERAGVKV